jgi:hypothetical protein
MNHRAKSDPRRRRFTLLDAVVLIAATALALRLCQDVMAGQTEDFRTPWEIVADMKARGFLFAPVQILYWSQIAAPFLVCWNLVLVPLHLVPPRPRLRSLARRPGLIAGLATTATLAIVGSGGLLLALPSLWGAKLDSDSLGHAIYPTSFRAMLSGMFADGVAIASAWIVMAIGGRRRPEPIWIDRLGRALGWTTILLTPLYLWAALIVQ